MWKETATRMLVGFGGLAVGALFVLTLRGAAQADADRLQLAHARATAVAAAVATEPADRIGALAAAIDADAPWSASTL
ncbi:MAG TPA: hypothetical protein VLW55_09680 [Burkholderiaceae bacterium]|nr:hypothetical protein [Burkholderiaceae bacterium]